MFQKFYEEFEFWRRKKCVKYSKKKGGRRRERGEENGSESCACPIKVREHMGLKQKKKKKKIA